MNERKSQDRQPFACPHCGAEVPAGSLACPECGSDEKTGWAKDAATRSVDIPTGYAQDDEFDYGEFVKREFGGRSRKIAGLPARALRLLLLGALVVGLVILVLRVW